MRHNRSFTRDIDWLTVFLYVALVFIGWANIYSADYNPKHPSIFDFDWTYGKQMVWIAAAFVLAMMIMIVDSNFYTATSFFVFGVTIALLVVTFLIARTVHGDRNWIDIGEFKLQPSEFAKFATALALAKFLSSLNISFKSNQTRFYTLAIILVPTILVLAQGDTGSALVFSAFILVLYREGFPTVFYIICFYIIALSLLILYNMEWISDNRVIVITAGVLMIVVTTVLGFVYKRRKRLAQFFTVLIAASCAYLFVVDMAFNKVLEKHQQNRINVLLGKIHDPRGLEWNVENSKMAIGAGGWTGKGFRDGTVTATNYVPEQSTDFIFCTIGEEWGFLGTSFLILLFLALMIRIFQIAERQRSTFTRIYAYCTACIFFVHFTINVGMTIGLVPVIGIPLPFISYGGSSMFSFTILLFILLKLDSNRFMVLR